MTDDELRELLNDLESDRCERKAALSDPNRVREAICAFANDLPDHRQPGVVFIGAEDERDLLRKYERCRQILNFDIA